MRLIRRRHTYWSCGAFSQWLTRKAGIEPLKSASISGWEEYDNKFKKKSPIIFYVVDTLLDSMENCVMFPIDVYNTLHSYIHNRCITKTHLVSIDHLRGSWIDTDFKLMLSIFYIMADFVENECAVQYYYSLNPDEQKKYKKPVFYKKYNSAEMGVKCIDMQCQVLTDDFMYASASEVGQPSEQAKAFYKLGKIYDWWKVHKSALESGEMMSDRSDEIDENLIKIVKLRKVMWF